MDTLCFLGNVWSHVGQACFSASALPLCCDAGSDAGPLYREGVRVIKKLTASLAFGAALHAGFVAAQGIGISDTGIRMVTGFSAVVTV